MQLLLGILLAGLPLVSMEVLCRRMSIEPEASRKIVHVASSLVACLLTTFLPLAHIALIGILFSVIILGSRRIRLWRSLYGVRRKSWGEIFFPVSVALCAFLANGSEKNFIAAMLVMGLADTAASLIGQGYGKHKLPIIKQKSAEGSMAFFIVSAIIYFAIFGSLWWLPVVALAATTIEAFSSYGADNLTVPIASIIFIRIIG
jgi:phytol kinase